MANLAIIPIERTESIAQLVEDYLLSARARGCAPATVNGAYGFPLRKIFLPWCGERGIQSLAACDARTIDAFSAFLLERRGQWGKPLSRHSIHSYARAVRTFFTWCNGHGHEVEAAPQLPRLPRRVLDVLTREEIGDMESASPSDRDKLVVRLLADTGIRANELCQLKLDDIVRRGTQTFLKIQGKGARERLVPIVPPLFRRLEQYIRRQRPTDHDTDRIFVSLTRRSSGVHEPLTPDGLNFIIQSAAQRAGITKRVYTHLMRHSWFTNGLRGGMDALTLSRIGGHSSLRMLQDVYSHLNNEDDYEALARLFMKPG
jgi:integrase/recombinase XerD